MTDPADDAKKSDDFFPPGWSPEQMPAPPAPPDDGRDKRTLALIALAVVVVVVVGAVLFFTRDTKHDSGPVAQPSADTRPAATSAEAPATLESWQDVAPVAVITADPTCQPWRSIQSTLKSAQSNGWEQRDASVPRDQWDDTVRLQYETVGTAMSNSANDAVALARQTPHRVMKELYEQFIAFGRSYAAALVTYEPIDDTFAQANTAAFQAISEICAAADSGSAIARAPAVAAAAPPSLPPVLGDPSNPGRFIPAAGPTCARWVPAEAQRQASTLPWVELDPDLTREQWTPDQRAVADAATAVFRQSADTMEADGRASGNEVFEDFATLAALYFRTYVAAFPNYAPADRNLGVAGLRLDTLIASACEAAAAHP